jgi:hypothetical protein
MGLRSPHGRWQAGVGPLLALWLDVVRWRCLAFPGSGALVDLSRSVVARASVQVDLCDGGIKQHTLFFGIGVLVV